MGQETFWKKGFAKCLGLVPSDRMLCTGGPGTDAEFDQEKRKQENF